MWNPNRTSSQDAGDGRGPAMLRAVISLVLGESGLEVAKHSVVSVVSSIKNHCLR